ncbi:MAG: UTP--glucose-1-phosphate uridylyltransferase [bacterium]|nr:UTP--glucose-1-phosphate uridylyltransferase [bacterium]
MRREGLPEIAIRTFAQYYAQLAAGQTGLLPEADLEPATGIPDAEALPAALAAAGRRALPHTVMLKLNGGLGTGMGLERAKSLLTVKDGLTFLEIIAHQARTADVPLLLMNSFSTRADSLALLAGQSLPDRGLPADFLQHKVPKVRADDLRPAHWPADPDLAWCPPGHGDLYTALVTSGVLERLLAGGFRWAFVSNADNLGATIDPVILGHVVASGAPLVMEVADRTAADRKGGHLARRRDGRLILREVAQCPPADEEAFQDIARHRYFNTNTLWLDLPALDAVLRRDGGIMRLPMIRNRKTLDPRDPASPAVYQLETAMGAAIETFAGAGALRVPRARFAPIKHTSDLLNVRSDNFLLTEDHRVVPNPQRALPPAVIDLDPAYYRFVDDLERRFPGGPPSLLACSRLVVRGDVRFGRGVAARGEVVIEAEPGTIRVIPDGATL